MGNFVFSQKSLKNLQGVHPDLVLLVKRALDISTIDFSVLEGLRSPARQQDVINLGKSWTKNSRHLTGHAIDVGVVIDRHINWYYPWYEKLHKFFKQASDELKIAIEWGGEWPERDGGHYELAWEDYPLK